MDHLNNMACFTWNLTCEIRALRIELFHDTLNISFSDLAEATTAEEERQASIASSSRVLHSIASPSTQEDSVFGNFKSLGDRDLVEKTEFFDEAWVLKMTVSFVDICKALQYTTQHEVKFKAFDTMLFLSVAGLIGLSMLLGKVTISAIVVCVVVLYFGITSIHETILVNNWLKKVGHLSWDCYGELITRSLLFKGEEDLEDDSSMTSLKYKQVINTAKVSVV